MPATRPPLSRVSPLDARRAHIRRALLPKPSLQRWDSATDLQPLPTRTEPRAGSLLPRIRKVSPRPETDEPLAPSPSQARRPTPPPKAVPAMPPLRMTSATKPSGRASRHARRGSRSGPMSRSRDGIRSPHGPLTPLSPRAHKRLD